MSLTEKERAEAELWLENLKTEARQLGAYLSESPGPGKIGCRKNYGKSVRRFKQVTLRIAILERIASS